MTGADEGGCPNLDTVQMCHETGNLARASISLSDTPNALVVCGSTAIALLPDCLESFDLDTVRRWFRKTTAADVCSRRIGWVRAGW